MRTRRLVVELTNGSAFYLPGENIPGLESATDDELAQVEVGAAGVWLRWEALDADLSVVGVARLVLGTETLLRAAGAAGGSVTSEAKAEAARRNGLKGGRPPKSGESATLSGRKRKAR